jgi:broad specificity phosphatase PhoE
MQIKIIRHSERLDFSYPVYWMICFGHYWADSPLTTNGHKIANEKGKQMISGTFNPKYIYTSPYKRTMATSTEIKSACPQSEIIIEPLLSEYQPYYKHSIDLYPNGIPTTYNGTETNFSFPETYEAFTQRVEFIIYKLIEKNTDDLIIITHGEVLKVFISHIQTRYPDVLIDSGTTPYLTVLAFEFDKETNTIKEDSIRIE